jgi:copper chaperone
MRILPVFGLFALSVTAPAQFRTIEMQFEGIGCASCIESLPSRVQRMRGVTSAKVDAEKQVLRVELEPVNRVRVEQVRDAIEQDGTKTTLATVRLIGNVSQIDGKWILSPSGVPSTYELSGALPAKVKPGSYRVTGRIEKLRPESVRLVIVATEITAP